MLPFCKSCQQIPGAGPFHTASPDPVLLQPELLLTGVLVETCPKKPQATQTNPCPLAFHESQGAGPAEFQIWCLSADEHGRKGEAVGTKTGRQVGSPVPGVKQPIIYPHPQSGLLEAGGGREWGGIFYF